MEMFARITFILFGLTVPFLIYGFGSEALRAAATVSLRDPRWQAFLIGCAAFLPSMFVARRVAESVWGWIETFEHEFTHLIFALAFFKLPVSFKVTAHKGGEVQYVGRGKVGTTWITLAPYFFPTVSIVVVLIAWAGGIASNYLLGALGWTTLFHLVTNWSETSFRQPDLKKAGLVRTLAVLPVMNIVCYGAVLAFVAGGGGGFGNFWIQGLAQAYRLAAQLLSGARSIG